MRNGVIPRGRKKSSAVPLFYAYAVYHLHPSYTPRETGVQRGGRNRRCLPFFVPAPDGARSPHAAACEISPRNGEPLYPMKSSTRSAALCIACSALCAACLAFRRIDGLSIAPAATIETTAPAIAPVAMPETKGEIRIKRSTAFHKVYRISMPARPSNFTQQKIACLAQSTIYNRMFILYNISNNPPLRCGP